jgi:putative thioredoxin
VIRECQDFSADVVEASRRRPVLVDFWAEWCGPCRVLGPVLERLATQAGDRWDLVKVDIEGEPGLAQEFQIQSIPAVKLFSDGTVVAEFLGALPQPQIEAWLAAHLPAKEPAGLGAARAALGRGDRAQAQVLLRKALDEAPEAGEPRALLAELLLLDDPDQAVHVAGQVPAGDPAHERAAAVATLAAVVQLARAMEGGSPPPPAGSKPGVWERYLEGARAFHGGKFDDALQAWIEVLGRDRALDDDGARRACVALFRWLGEEHPTTQRYRRAFSSALY